MPRLAALFPVLGLAVTFACDPQELEPLACDEPGRSADVRLPLAHASDWRESSADTDPLPEHRPDVVACLGWGEEFGALELSTATCNYASLEQPLAESIEPGDRLHIELWWSGLFAPEPATAHLALLVDDALLWETEVEIPGPADARTIEFDSPISAQAGATLTFHLHNHGQNSWTLGAVERRSTAHDCQ
jgi:hypothetical protein